jgi:chemotaxis protein histidine kinase CheA
MMKKSLLLTVLTFGIATPHKTLRAELSGPEIAGLAVAGAATLCGIYAIGKQCDVWGNPNPNDILRRSNCLLEQVIQYRNILDVYITCPSEDFLYTLAIDDVHVSVHSWKLEHQSREISECLNYMRRSRHYSTNSIVQEQLRAAQGNLDVWARDLRSLEDYLCKHAPYFALFTQEKNCLNTYAQEVALYNSYAYNPEYLKNQLYQQAQCKYHDTYAMISYIKKLECDINSLQGCINKALGYNRATIAQRILEVMRYLHQLVVNDPSYVRLVNDYHRFKAEQERLRIERERLEYERIQAAAERARLARERERAEYARMQAQREREQATYAARLERERIAREIRLEKERQNYALDRENQQLDQQLQRERERARQIEQRERERIQQVEQRERERAQADARQKADADRRREQDRAAREKEESFKRREAEREQARKEETERAEQRRKYEEEQRKKRKREEKAAEEARKQQELKDEQYRYTVFDRFA